MTNATTKIGETAQHTVGITGYWFTGTVRAVMVAIIPLILVGLVVLLVTSTLGGIARVVRPS